MKITDRIYGEEEIGDEVLIDLINSRAVQRLKGISQMGLPAEYYHELVFSRYEHSIGVLVLLRRLGASLEEQVAGLLHDISHTAFSHVIDWVLGDPSKEDHQDNAHEEAVSDKEIVEILRKYGLNHRRIARVEDFSLLESDIPAICADRFDYAIREIAGWATKEEIAIVLGGIENLNGKMVFDNEEAAEIFSQGYLKCQTEHWAGADAKARYHILADVLKRALKLGVIEEKDFKKTDADIISALIISGDSEITQKLKLLEGKLKIKESDSGITLQKKLRYIDPAVVFENKERKLSEVSERYSLKLKEMLAESGKPRKIIVEGYNS